MSRCGLIRKRANPLGGSSLVATACTCRVDQPVHRLVLLVAPAARVVAVTEGVPPLVRRSYPLGRLLLLSCHPDPPQDGEGPRGCNKCFTRSSAQIATVRFESPASSAA